MILLANRHTHIPTNRDKYVGRGTPLGNPYSHQEGASAEFKVRTREEAVQKYHAYLLKKIKERDINILKELAEIWRMSREPEGVVLVCSCKPLLCHIDVIKSIVETYEKKG